jgi:hypothetical protein
LLENCIKIATKGCFQIFLLKYSINQYFFKQPKYLNKYRNN